jgi:hypothetical protein
MSGVSVSGALLGLGAGAVVGAGLWAVTDQNKNAPKAEDKLLWAGITTAASIGAFFVMKHGMDGGVARMSTFAATGMGLGSAAGYALTGVAQLGKS